MQNPSDAVSALPVPTATNPSPQPPRDGENATTTHRLRPRAATATHSTRHFATDACDRATNRRAISNAVVGRGTCPPMRVPPSSNSRRGRTGPTFATVEPALRNSDPWRPTAAFALSESMRIVRCMMAQQLPVGLYRSGSVDRPDMVEGQCTSMHLLCHVGREWVQTMARKATCEGITVDICISIESSAHGGIRSII